MIRLITQRNADRIIPALVATSTSQRALPALIAAAVGKGAHIGLSSKLLRKELLIALLPALIAGLLLFAIHRAVTTQDAVAETTGLVEMGSAVDAAKIELNAAPAELGELKEAPSDGLKEPPSATPDGKDAANAVAGGNTGIASAASSTASGAAIAAATVPTPSWFWWTLAVAITLLVLLYTLLNWQRYEVYKLLLASFFPVAFLIRAVLGTIVFGLATPTEAAAVGSIGGFVLAAGYLAVAKPSEERAKILRLWLPLWVLVLAAVVWFALLKSEFITEPVPLWIGWMSMAAFVIWCAIATVQVKLQGVLSESVFLTAKTSAMVCWLFVGSSIFSAAFALLGGQELIEKWVLSLGLSMTQFLLLSQFIVFILGWPLERTEIIVIFMPIFIPLLAKFNVDPLFFGLLVALNLQTAFLSPPVAMAAFYLKGVAPPHVTLNQIFAGMMPFMVIQVFALFLLYMFPAIGMWLPSVLYK